MPANCGSSCKIARFDSPAAESASVRSSMLAPPARPDVRVRSAQRQRRDVDHASGHEPHAHGAVVGQRVVEERQVGGVDRGVDDQSRGPRQAAPSHRAIRRRRCGCTARCRRSARTSDTDRAPSQRSAAGGPTCSRRRSRWCPMPTTCSRLDAATSRSTVITSSMTVARPVDRPDAFVADEQIVNRRVERVSRQLELARARHREPQLAGERRRALDLESVERLDRDAFTIRVEGVGAVPSDARGAVHNPRCSSSSRCD